LLGARAGNVKLERLLGFIFELDFVEQAVFLKMWNDQTGGGVIGANDQAVREGVDRDQAERLPLKAGDEQALPRCQGRKSHHLEGW